MSKDIHSNPAVLDRLIDFLYPCDEKLTQENIKGELKRLGIDIKPVLKRVQQLMETHKARSSLAKAREQRLAMVGTLQGLISPKVEDIRKGISDRISKLPSDASQLVFFHKLEDASSEEDLQSLLDDLEKLNTMQELIRDSQGK